MALYGEIWTRSADLNCWNRPIDVLEDLAGDSNHCLARPKCQ